MGKLAPGVLGLLAGCAVGLLAAWSGVVAAPAPLRGAVGVEAAPAPPAAGAAGTAPDALLAGEGGHSRFAVLAQRAAPGVVNVHTSRTLVQSVPDFGAPFGDLFGDLFDDPFGAPRDPGETPGPRRFSVPSLGTGFVISAEGLIVTNHHVIEDVDEIEIVFSDGQRADAEVVGSDAKTDIALIRASAEREYAPLPLGDSDALLPGDWVIAVGNPFGLDHTVTAGIVSAKGRDIGQGPYDDFIQTDAAINPGNSGGPLLNMAGEVIGIASAINPQANTIGFAVPINLAKEILPQLEEHGRVVRGWLGVAVQPVTPELAEALDLESQEGALVSQVTAGGPAAAGGLERGDVIVRFGQEDIGEVRQLLRVVAATAPGTQVDVVVLRDGRRETKTVTVAELAEESAGAGTPGGEGEDRGSTSFGFDIADVPPDLARQLGLGASEGALITRVYPGGPGDGAGLRAGDVILEVDREAVGGGLDAERRLSEADDGALLLVRRDEASLFVAIERRRE
jgi:serine protease Do